MPDTDNPNTQAIPTLTDSLKTWTMAVITLVFVTLYALSIAGRGVPSDAVNQLQPIVFVIIGYYFGRLPSQQVEGTLKEQVRIHANNATAARNAERKTEVERGIFEERVKNARIILETARAGNGEEGANTGPPTLETAVKILSS
jgi:hypothetical protein